MSEYSQLKQQALEMVKSVLPNVVTNDDKIYSFTFGDGQRGVIRTDKSHGYSASNKPYNVSIEIIHEHRSNYGDTNERSIRKFASGPSSSITYTKAQKERLVEIAERVKRNDEDELRAREYKQQAYTAKEQFTEELKEEGFNISFATDYMSNTNMKLEVNGGNSATLSVTLGDAKKLAKLRDYIAENFAE